MRQTGTLGKSKNYLTTLFLLLLTTLYTYVHKELQISKPSDAADRKAGDQLDESPDESVRRILIEDDRIESRVKLEASRATLPNR